MTNPPNYADGLFRTHNVELKLYLVDKRKTITCTFVSHQLCVIVHAKKNSVASVDDPMTWWVISSHINMVTDAVFHSNPELHLKISRPTTQRDGWKNSGTKHKEPLGGEREKNNLQIQLFPSTFTPYPVITSPRNPPALHHTCAFDYSDYSDNILHYFVFILPDFPFCCCCFFLKQI